MATDKNTPNTSKVSSQAVVKQVKQPSLLDKFKSNRLVLLAVVAIVLLAIFVALYFVFTNIIFSKPAIKVGDITVSKQDYKEMLADYKKSPSPEGLAEAKVPDFIVDTLKYRAVSKDSGLVASDDEIKYMATSMYNDYDGNLSKWQLLVAENKVYKAKLSHENSNDKKIVRLTYPYSRYFSNGQEKRPDGFGDIKLIEQDKKYALEKANADRDAIKADPSQVKAQSLVNGAKSDQRLTYGSAGNNSAILYYNPYSGIFHKNNVDTELINEQEQVKIAGLEKGGVSEIYEEKQNKYYSAVKEYQYDAVPYSFYFYTWLKNTDFNLVKKVEVLKNQLEVVKNV